MDDAGESTTTALRACPLCEACCGLALTVRGAEVVGVRGHGGDVLSHGYLCPKAAALPELHADPDRLRKPLIKREGGFVEVEWDEAFAEIERRLPPILASGGRDALGVVLGNPTAHKIGLLTYVPRLVRGVGTRNVFSASTLDQMPKQLACGLMFGHWLSVPVPDIDRCELLVILGGNPAVSNGSMWTVPDFRGRARRLRERGGRIIVIDPRRTETAELADQHLFLRPGSDPLLLAAMVQVLFAESRVRLGRLAEHVVGVEALADAVRELTPERVADACGMTASAIRELARALADSPRAALYGRLGTCTQAHGTVASWLVDAINVLTGHLDAEGGVMFAKAAAFANNTQGASGRGKGIVVGRHHSRVSGAPEVFGELPMTCLAEEIETPGDGQLRALVTVASNPVLSSPGGPRLAAALERLELMISLDIYLNETTRHADVILPGTSPLTDAHYDVAFPQLAARNYARYSHPVLAPEDDRPREWEILLRLLAIATDRASIDLGALDDELVAADVQRLVGPAAPMVLQAVAHRRGPDRLLDLALRAGPYGDGFGLRPGGLDLAQVMAAPDGIDLGALTPRIPELLRTPSGRIELAPPRLLADLVGVHALADEPRAELVAIGRRHLRSNNSWMHNLPVLAKGPVRCTARVHPDDAARLGLVDGGLAEIATAASTITLTVEISDEMMPGVVSVPHGWGHDHVGTRMHVARARPGANLNALIDPATRDAPSGNAVLSGIPITMTPRP